MATAFSYSGTGLESAIATGSGGLSSTATSVEVDSIPSDLSAGDTVKIALGTATNFANGNGEVAHGDIGTIAGGANGGTNITGLSRGQEGTTASSFSEGDSVRVGVQGSDDAGPERGVVQSQVWKDNPRLLAYADFDRDDQSVSSGFEIASGHSITVQRGSPEIVNGSLKLPSDSVFTIDNVSTTNFWVRCFFTHSTTFDEIARASIIYDWVDGNNWVLFRRAGHLNWQITKNISGTTTVLSTKTKENEVYRVNQPIEAGSTREKNTLLGVTKFSSVKSVKDSDVNNTFTLGSNIGFGNVQGDTTGENVYLDQFAIHAHNGNETF